MNQESISLITELENIELMDYYGILIKVLSENFEKNANILLQQRGLTNSQAKVLVFLANNEDHALTLKQLETLTNTSQPNMVGIVSRLEKKGLLERCEFPGDRRIKMVVLSEKGEEAIGHGLKLLKEMEKKYTAGMTEEERRQLIILLNKARQNCW